MVKDDIQDGPTPEQIKHLLQQSILRNYPNPNRDGCLDSSAITAIAQQRLPHQDPRWGHISHCSPCYREFLGYRERFRENKERAAQSRRKLRLALLVPVAVVALSAMAILKS